MGRGRRFQIVCAAVAALVPAVPYAPATSAAGLEASIRELAAYEFGQPRDAVLALRRGLRASPAGERPALERALLAVVMDDEAAPVGRRAAGDLLREIATSASVPVLAGLLLDEDRLWIAPNVLDALPDEGVTAAYLAALPKASGRVRLGLVESLGCRAGLDVTEALHGLLRTDDGRLFEAALFALAGRARRRSPCAAGRAGPARRASCSPSATTSRTSSGASGTARPPPATSSPPSSPTS